MTRRIAFFLTWLLLAGGAAADEATIAQSFWIDEDIDISQAVAGPVHAIGRTVTVTAPIDGRAYVVGRTVKLGSAAVVSGDAMLAGRRVTVDGSIKGALSAAGRDVRINGPVTGDASIAARTLELGPDARIQGKLTFRGKTLHRDPAAQVVGGIDDMHGSWRGHESPWGERLLWSWIWVPGTLLIAALIAAVFPGTSNRMAQELRERPWITPLLGLVALTCIPVAAVLLMITIIGIPLGILALLVYVALLFVAYIWVGVVVGGMLLDRVKPETAAQTAWRVGAAVLASLVLAILVHVPFVGGLFKFAALIVGVGMIIAAMFRHSRTAEPQPV